MSEAAIEAPVEALAEAPIDDRPPIPVRCRETGFRAKIPAADWEAYLPAQREAYERLEVPEGVEAQAPAPKARKIKEG